jgi:energy-coupling factor transport system ATP-binding protein
MSSTGTAVQTPLLKRLNPTLRLGVVFTLDVIYIFINNLPGAAAILVVGLVIYFASCGRNKKLALAALFPGLMLFVYNSVLSPHQPAALQWWIFTIDLAGIERGLVTGMRLVGVMLVSFAWLIVTPVPEIYQGLEWLKPARAWVLELLRGVQIVKREFIALTQSLIIRGLKWDSPLANIKNLVPLAMAIVPRVADNAQKTTFALQSHQTAAAAEAQPGGIEITQATVRYSPRLPDVLHEVSLQIDPGEFIYLAGPDGAGKTSLMRLMGGVIPRIMGEFKGQVRVGGLLTHEVALSELCKVVRYVAPDPFSSIYGLTVGQEISFLVPDEKTAREKLAFMGIDHLWDRETTKLSGGQQVRLVLAGALASQARYLLLDSPMQELDPQGRGDFMEALEALHSQREVAVVAADPFWRQLSSYARRVVVLEGGRLSQSLPPADFFTVPWLERCHLNTHLDGLAIPTPGSVIARMENVYVSLENNPILNGVDLEVREGELLAIMGPNGSGKTTAMLTLAGAIKPARGQVITQGRVAYTFQDARLQLVADTVRNELALGPNILKWPPSAAEPFIQKGLAWTGIDADVCPLDIHPAQARLLAIAAGNTDVSAIILDEPTVGIDAAGVEKVMGLVTELLAQGKAVIIITHDEAVASLAHRIVVIRDGKVAEEKKAALPLDSQGTIRYTSPH